MADIVVITGSRKLTDEFQVKGAFYAICERRDNKWLLNQGGREIEWHHGGAQGVDSIIDGHLRDWSIEPVAHLPDYKKFGRRQAPHVRNNEMIALKPRAIVAIWDGNSPGTGSVIGKAARKGIPVFVEVVSR